jgi:hypothetical protein
VTIYGLVVLALIMAGGAARIQYDDGLSGLLYHFILMPVLGFMFYFPKELGLGFVLSIFVGLSFCGVVDYVRHRLRARK